MNKTKIFSFSIYNLLFLLTLHYPGYEMVLVIQGGTIYKTYVCFVLITSLAKGRDHLKKNKVVIFYDFGHNRIWLDIVKKIW